MLGFVGGAVAPRGWTSSSWAGGAGVGRAAIHVQQVRLQAGPGRTRPLRFGGGGVRCQHTASDAVPRRAGNDDAAAADATDGVAPKAQRPTPADDNGAPASDDEAPEYYEDVYVPTGSEEEEAEMILQRQAKVARELALLAVAQRQSKRSQLPTGADDGSSSMVPDPRRAVTQSALEAEKRELDARAGAVEVPRKKKTPITLIRCDGYICERESVEDGHIVFRGAATEQVMLVWNARPRRVLILTKKGPDLLPSLIEAVRHLVTTERVAVMVEPAVHEEVSAAAGVPVETFDSPSSLHECVDLVVCLGGDGLILHVSTLFRGPVPPVLSFNLGSLGFLTPFDFKDFGSNMASVFSGQCLLSLRMRLTCSVLRDGEVVKEFDVLNEVVVDRGASPYLSNLDCFCDGKLITTVQADGIIMSTPTGSTAYSMSAGGSMVHPSVPAILFTPICPHSLSFRPIVFPDAAQLRIDVAADSRSMAWASFDGKYRQQLRRGDGLMVQMSMFPVPTVNAEDDTSDWFASLDRAFNFNSRAKQKGF